MLTFSTSLTQHDTSDLYNPTMCCRIGDDRAVDRIVCVQIQQKEKKQGCSQDDEGV